MQKGNKSRLRDKYTTMYYITKIAHTKFKQFVIGIVSQDLLSFNLGQLKEYCKKYKIKRRKVMSLKMKLTASISALILVLGFMLMGIMAVEQATVNMGGSISFTATDVYAHVTGSIANDTSSPSNLDVTYSAEETTGDPTVWNDLSLAFDSQATPIEVTITVENLSPQNTLRVNLNDTLSSTIGNLEKVVKNDGEAYTNQTDITLQPNGQENDSTTFRITMSIIDKNTSLTADFDYELNLFDQYYVEPPVYERVDADGIPNPEGDYLYFGYYPQSAKADNVAIESGPDETTGYYLGSDDEYYAMAEDGNYYKVERLRWRILDDNYGDGTALIVCDVIVDQVVYQSNIDSSYTYATDGSNILIDNDATPGQGVDSNHQVYANNYKHSELREYLIGTFYDTAFSETEKASIVLTEVDNSTASGARSPRACENTNDYVFTLSYNDIFNTDYGFTSGGNDPKRAFIVTDYADANGAWVYSIYEGTGYNWLRSPAASSDYVFGVFPTSDYDYYSVDSTHYGALPALQIRL